MTVADRSFFDTTDAWKSSESTLVRDLGATRDTGFGWRSSPEEAAAESEGALRQAAQILETKATDELPAYRAFMLEVAESVVAAAEGGETAEAGPLEKIRTAVGG
jgi:hypothetical protein